MSACQKFVFYLNDAPSRIADRFSYHPRFGSSNGTDALRFGCRRVFEETRYHLAGELKFPQNTRPQPKVSADVPFQLPNLGSWRLFVHPSKIELSWIVVADLKKAKEFYTKVLGLKVNESSDEYGWLEVQGTDGGSLLGIAQASEQEEMKAGGNAVVTITVKDLDAAISELKKKHVHFIGDILEIPGQVKMITFSDSDGNRFQLAQKL